jgi:CheY-like chemotaxis protein
LSTGGVDPVDGVPEGLEVGEAPTDGTCAHPEVSDTGKGTDAEGKILVVDDDEGVQAVARSMLEAAGHQVLTAGDGREGLAIFARHANEISLVLLDLTMPRLGGDEVLAELRLIDPDARVILMSGYSEQRVQRQLGSRGPAGFLQKPFRSEELILKLKQAFDS